MIVCIAEKPSVAKDIAKVLGATTAHDGYLEGNGYRVTWTFGHLCELKAPDDYCEEWKSWALGRLPMIPAHFGIKLKRDKGVAKQFETIKRLFEQADEIVNCGDAGQEGELIQRWVRQKALGGKSVTPVKRLWISSLTEEAILQGFATLRPESDYNSLYQAGLCRAIGDWLLGMNATRLYTLRYRQGQRQVLSIGRVQTPTLALIVNRQKEIEEFRPVPYWLLATLYRDTLFTLKGSDKEDDEPEKGEEPSAGKKKAAKGSFATREEGLRALESIRGKEFTVTGIGKKQGSEAPPRLFDLTSLQVECNKKFAFSADETLKYIQSLYEKKLTTYPRVDTTYLSDDIYPKCPKTLEGLRPYAALVQPLLQSKLPKSKKVFDSSKVTDHHAIIPTGVDPSAASLSRNEKLVYDLVARRFIAVFYPDCKFATTTVTGKVEKLEFRATGKQILDPGWRLVLEKKKPAADPATAALDARDNDEEGDDEKVLADFVKGEHGPHEPTLSEKATTPPKPYTEATLLRAMETAGKLVENDELRDALKENGIGRPSTRAAIIETLFKRGYIQKQRKALVATPTGVDLIGVIREELLKSAELTGQWEKKLREIEACKYDAALFVEELKQMVCQLVQEVMQDNSNRRVASAPTPTAKKSKSPAIPSESKAEKPKRATRTRKKKTDEPAAAPAQETPPPSLQVKEGDVCPLCGKGRILRGKTALGCSEWRAGCTFRHPLPEGE